MNVQRFPIMLHAQSLEQLIAERTRRLFELNPFNINKHYKKNAVYLQANLSFFIKLN